MSISLEDKFYYNVDLLGRIIHNIVYKLYEGGIKIIHPSIVEAAMNYVKKHDKHKLVTKFIEVSVPFWDQILVKSDEFFVKHSKIVFSELVEKFNSDIDLFSDLMTCRANGKLVVVPEEREKIWRCFHGLVKISLHYIKNNKINVSQMPKLSLKGYKFDLEKTAKDWAVNLN